MGSKEGPSSAPSLPRAQQVLTQVLTLPHRFREGRGGDLVEWPCFSNCFPSPRVLRWHLREDTSPQSVPSLSTGVSIERKGLLHLKTTPVQVKCNP